MGIETSRLDVLPPDVMMSDLSGVGAQEKWGFPGAAALSCLALAASGGLPASAIAETTTYIAADGYNCTVDTTEDDSTDTTTVHEVCVSPDGQSTREQTTTKPTEPSADEEQDESDQHPNRGERPKRTNNTGRNKSQNHYNLLEVPSKRHATRYWATKILNETRKGQEGRISSSHEAKTNLFQARDGKCSPVEQIPGRCVKLSPTLLMVIFKASLLQKFYIWHLTGGPHVPNSHHFDGDATDLRRFDGTAPNTKALFPILRSVTPPNKSTEMLGPGDNAAHTGPKNGHIHYAVF